MYQKLEYQLYPLKNGFRFLHRPHFISGITHCCLLIQIGSRDEKRDKIGMAHFVEHMLFKGTRKRNNRQILSHLELVGGEINAYTTKEYTCLHASFLDQYLTRALDLLKDMVMESTYPTDEITREISVISDEIDSYKDIPEESIQDSFEEMIFQSHPLGNNILGTKESISTFRQSDLLDYSKTHFCASNMVLGIYNSMTSQHLRPIVERFFEDIPQSKAGTVREKFNLVMTENKTLLAPIHQVHGIIGGISYSAYEKGRMPMLLLMNLLGGPSMSSRLNLEIREKRGICYQIESNYLPLSDTGIFSIYFGTDMEKYEKCLELIHKELNNLRVKGLSSLYLSQSKARFKGQIALADENHASVLISLCKSIQDYGYANSIKEIFEMVDNITLQDILEVSNRHFNLENISSLTLKPIH